MTWGDVVPSFDFASFTPFWQGGRREDGSFYSQRWHGDHWVDVMTEADLGIEEAWTSTVWRVL